jgi:hypothetical protein
MKNIALIILFCLTFTCFESCTYKSISEEIAGRWQYVAVMKNGQPFMQISDGDHLLFHTDSTFSYHIKQENKIGKGRWRITKEKHIELHYTEPSEMVRTFEIQLFTDRKLSFMENGVSFSFSRSNR